MIMIIVRVVLLFVVVFLALMLVFMLFDTAAGGMQQEFNLWALIAGYVAGGCSAVWFFIEVIKFKKQL